MTHPTSLLPVFRTLYARASTQSAQELSGLLTEGSNQHHIRGVLYAHQLVLDVLRYHINRPLCRLEDGRQLARNWRAMAARAVEESARCDPLRGAFLRATAATLVETAQYLDAAVEREQLCPPV